MRYALPLIVVLMLIALIGLDRPAPDAPPDTPPVADTPAQQDLADAPYVGEWAATRVPEGLDGTATTMTINADGTLHIVIERDRRDGINEVEAEWWISGEHRLSWTNIRGDRVNDGEVEFSVPGRLLLFLPGERPLRFEPAER